MRDASLLEKVQHLTLKSLITLCGDENQAHGSEWRQYLTSLSVEKVSWTTKERDWSDPEGKPWDIEVRVAPSLYYRYHDKQTKLWRFTSDLGVSRSVPNPVEFAKLLVPYIEEAWKCDVDPASGFICIVSPERSEVVRDAGKLPCPYCLHWMKGGKGLWWHIQQKHEAEHGSAMNAATATMPNLPMVLYDSDKTVASSQRSPRARRSERPSSISPFDAARDGNLSSLQNFVSDGFDPLSVDSHGAAVIHWAAGSGHLEIVRYVIKQLGCSVNLGQVAKRAFGGRTALHWAARKGHLEVVQSLVDEFGADLESETLDGTTAFCWAAWQGHEQILKFLYEAGAKVNSVNSFGCNACLWAAQGTAGQEVLDWLVASGCSLTATNLNGHSVLHKAAQRGGKGVCRWMISRFSEMCDLAEDQRLRLIQPDLDGCVPSDLAAMEGHRELALQLTRYELDTVKRVRSYDELPEWIAQRPSVLSSSLSFDFGEGLIRLQTCVHSETAMEELLRLAIACDFVSS